MEKLTNYIERPASVLTGKANLEPLYQLRDFPVFFGCVDTLQEGDLVADMNWAIDPETGIVQLTRLIPLEVLYQAQHVDGCGSTWQQYYLDFADYIVKQRPKNVLEIGGGQGALAEAATSKDSQLTWTIVEPNPTHPGNKQITIERGFVDENFRFDQPVDTVVFSQVLEHTYNPQKFISAIGQVLAPGGRLIFAYPNLELWLERKYTNALNFEHTMLLTDIHLDYLLPKLDFKVLDKTIYKDHSFFYTVEKSKEPPEFPKPINKYHNYKRIFMDFVNYHETTTSELNQKIRAAKEPVFLFGAHIFSTYLIAFGLNTEKISGVLDNSPTKRGHRLYGTRFIVESPKILKGKGPVNIILKAGIYNDEIKKDILENINNQAVFW